VIRSCEKTKRVRRVRTRSGESALVGAPGGTKTLAQTAEKCRAELGSHKESETGQRVIRSSNRVPRVQSTEGRPGQVRGGGGRTARDLKIGAAKNGKGGAVNETTGVYGLTWAAMARRNDLSNEVMS